MVWVWPEAAPNKYLEAGGLFGRWSWEAPPWNGELRQGREGSQLPAQAHHKCLLGKKDK